MAARYDQLAEMMNQLVGESIAQRNNNNAMFQILTQNFGQMISQSQTKIATMPPMAAHNLTILSAYLKNFRDWMIIEGLTDEATAAKRFLPLAFTGTKKDHIKQILNNGGTWDQQKNLIQVQVLRSSPADALRKFRNAEMTKKESYIEFFVRLIAIGELAFANDNEKTAAVKEQFKTGMDRDRKETQDMLTMIRDPAHELRTIEDMRTKINEYCSDWRVKTSDEKGMTNNRVATVNENEMDTTNNIKDLSVL